MNKTIIAAFAAVLVTSCGGGEDLPPDMAKVAAKVGCDPFAIAVVKPMLSHEHAVCGDDRAVITFNNNKDRDAFPEVAEQHGGAYEEGNGYLVETSPSGGL
jgi:hypothetical protein